MEYNGKSIQFLDYCAGDSIIESVERNETDSVKICLVGGAGKNASDERVSRKYDNKGYAWEASIQEILDVLGNRKDCCIHFYAADLRPENIEICKELELQYYNFKFFVDVAHNQLIQMLSKYDYGCELFTDGQILPCNETLNGLNGGAELLYGVANKYFDYLDAGLSIIATYPEMYLDYLDQCNVVVRMNTANLDVEYLKTNKMKYKENANMAKREFCIDNQISRLIDFFKSV